MSDVTMQATPAPIDRPGRLHVSVLDSLKAHISANRLKPGDALPPETALARSLGVSRTSVREAIKALESVGVLETRHGIGVFVREFSFEPLIEHLSFGAGHALRDLADILDVRCTLETGLIGKAIERLGDPERDALQRTLAEMRLKAERSVSFAEEDQRFHAQLFAALENRVLLRVLDVFWRAFHRATALRDMRAQDPVRTWRDHDAIFQAVLARDVEGARTRLEAHYDGLRERLLASRPPP